MGHGSDATIGWAAPLDEGFDPDAVSGGFDEVVRNVSGGTVETDFYGDAVAGEEGWLLVVGKSSNVQSCEEVDPEALESPGLPCFPLLRVQDALGVPRSDPKLMMWTSYG